MFVLKHDKILKSYVTVHMSILLPNQEIFLLNISPEPGRWS